MMLRFAAVIIAMAGATAWAHEAEPGAGMGFVPPAPGTYRLEKIQRVPEGTVLDTNAKAVALARFAQGKVTLLSFMFTTCMDPEGCPLAYDVMDQVQATLQTNTLAQRRVQLISLSFDPLVDTPEVMADYGESQLSRKSGLPWYFLTTPTYRELAPLLKGLGQDVRIRVDPKTGEASRSFSHVLKVFLIDANGWVREIYTTSYLLPQVVVNDIQSLLLEEQRAN
ncbi:MAG: SCO family protein [Burkholderiales bacterium]